MKADELMIGDWVVRESHKNNPVKVIELYKRGVVLKLEHGWCGEAIDLIEPIPLTPEILEKNGFKGMEFTHKSYGFCLAFKHNKEYIWIYWRDSCNTMTSAGTEDIVSELWGIEFCNKGCDLIKCSNKLYVHELQHALRLCGPNNLADNFKV